MKKPLVPKTIMKRHIGSAKNNRPKFTKIVWTKDNVKTLGIHHGYNIQNDEIWKSIIDKNEKLCPRLEK